MNLQSSKNLLPIIANLQMLAVFGDQVHLCWRLDAAEARIWYQLLQSFDIVDLS